MQALIFTLLKYIEIGIMAVSMLIVAREIGPEQMGIAMPIFLFITYSNYLNLGSSQLILKYFSIESKERYAVIDVAAKVLLFSLVSALVVSFIVLDSQFSLKVGLVSCCILTRSVMIANLRAKNNYRKINVNNIIVSLVMLIGSSLFIEDVVGLVGLLLVVNVSSVCLYIISDLNFSKDLTFSIRKKLSMDVFKLYLIVAIKLSVIGLFSTLLLTLDKLLLQVFDFTEHQYGLYQLSDNIANLIYVGLSTVLFFMYPKLISRLRADKAYRKNYLYAQLVMIPGYFIGLVLLWYLSDYMEHFLFPEFRGLSGILIYSAVYKISIFQLSLMSILFIARDRESYMVRVYLFTVLFILLSVFTMAGFWGFYNIKYIIVIAVIAINSSYIYEFFKEKKQIDNRLFRW